MTDFPFDIVGFDLDGTLVDSAADLLAAVNHALALAGRPLLSLDQIRGMIGGGAKNMLIQGLEASGGCDPDEFKPLYRALLAHYEAHVSVHTHPFPGAVAALDRLTARGVKLAIVTNKFERFAIRLVEDLGIAHYFQTLIGGDTLGTENAKPSPAPIHEMLKRLGGGRAAFIGDSRYDMMAARAAGIPSIACSFGFLSEPVEALAADAVIDSYADLIPALAALSPTGA